MKSVVKTKLEETFTCVPSYRNTPFVLTRKNNAIFPIFPHSGDWKEQEIVRYFFFLEEFEPYLAGRQHKKSIFEHLSTWIKTRNYRQCRIYHKKMLESFRTLPRVIEYLKKEISIKNNFKLVSRSQFDKIKGQIKKKLQEQTSINMLSEQKVFTVIQDENQSRPLSNYSMISNQDEFSDPNIIQELQNNNVYSNAMIQEPSRRKSSSLYDRIYKMNLDQLPKNNWNRNIYLDYQPPKMVGEIHVPWSQVEYENFFNS